MPINKYEKLVLIGASIGQAILLLPLELAIIPPHLHLLWLGLKVNMFGVAPVVITLIIRKLG